MSFIQIMKTQLSITLLVEKEGEGQFFNRYPIFAFRMEPKPPSARESHTHRGIPSPDPASVILYVAEWEEWKSVGQDQSSHPTSRDITV